MQFLQGIGMGTLEMLSVLHIIEAIIDLNLIIIVLVCECISWDEWVSTKERVIDLSYTVATTLAKGSILYLF